MTQCHYSAQGQYICIKKIPEVIENFSFYDQNTENTIENPCKGIDSNMFCNSFRSKLNSQVLLPSYSNLLTKYNTKYYPTWDSNENACITDIKNDKVMFMKVRNQLDCSGKKLKEVWSIESDPCMFIDFPRDYCNLNTAEHARKLALPYSRQANMEGNDWITRSEDNYTEYVPKWNDLESACYVTGKSGDYNYVKMKNQITCAKGVVNQRWTNETNPFDYT